MIAAAGTRAVAARPPIAAIVMQHVEEAAHLRHVRSVLVRAPHVRLQQLGRLDERLEAHLDGITVAGDFGRSLTHQALERPGTGEVFSATVQAIETRDAAALDRLLALAETRPTARAGLLSAFGWVPAPALQGLVRPLLDAASPWCREVGLAACSFHGVDPGPMHLAAMHDADAGLRARALSAAGRAGRVGLLPACLARVDDAEPSCAAEAVRAALLLGDRAVAMRAAAAPEGYGPRALRLVLKTVSPAHARALLASMAKADASARSLVGHIAVAGDPHFIPWLIERMDDPTLARLAGEAFSLVTGLDLARLGLDREPPPDFTPGPSDDPAVDDVETDEDDSLAWPAPAAVARWWQSNRERFPAGHRFFMGRPPSPEHCLEVLQTGGQRQRLAAAEHRCLLAPGTPLFDIAAPTRRQRRLLGLPRHFGG